MMRRENWASVRSDRTTTLPPAFAIPLQLAKPSKSNVSPTYENLVRKSFLSPTYAKTGGIPPVENVGATTFPIFHPFFRPFWSAATRALLSFSVIPTGMADFFSRAAVRTRRPWSGGTVARLKIHFQTKRTRGPAARGVLA